MEERERHAAPQDERPNQTASIPQPWWRRNIQWLIIGGAVVAIALAVGLGRRPQPAAGPAGAPPAQPSNAQMLDDLDGDATPLVQYQVELDLLASKCTQDETGIAALANAGYQDLVKYGINDETRLSVLRHLRATIPDGLKMDCASALSTYLVVREG